MWHIWISDMRQGKVILESDCTTTLNIVQLDKLCVNGASALGILLAVGVNNNLFDWFKDEYFEVSENVFYIDLKKNDLNN